MEKKCIIHIPDEKGEVLWNGLADAPIEHSHRPEIPYMSISTYNIGRRYIEPYPVKFHSIIGKNNNFLKEWIDSVCSALITKMVYANSYKKEMVVQFDNVEYKLYGCYPIISEIRNENLLTRFIILEKINNFSKSEPCEITFNIDSYSIGY